MTLESSIYCPDTLWLEIPAAALRAERRAYSHGSVHWSAYLNQLCQATVLEWIQQDFEPSAQVWPAVADQPALREFVSGTAIVCGALRLVFLPSEQIDRDEFRIPREWVEIPGWAAHYYLPVEIDCENDRLGIWGFVRYEQLHFDLIDHRDRTYCLDGWRVNPNLHTLWAAYELEVRPPDPQPVAPAALSSSQAEQLIAQWSDRRQMLSPRLQVFDFSQWLALLSDPDWREQLYAERHRHSVLRWLQRGSELPSGWCRPLAPAGGRGRSSGQAVLRQLQIAGQQYELRVFPLPDRPDYTWRFELRNCRGRVPGGLKLRLLTDERQPFENNEETAQTATDELYIDVQLDPGDGLIWEIEPQPDNFVHEVLYF
ncbi:DUF1822 family protein [Gloeobacter kilaueensis]|uniref:DUF1822 family protein n=1 Tax=Gloeobacter kilaueensis (strain ATCC BAA-2537 / CCAP 1431/1 / ULC 316 / JS1) TaxID=1183438 RepID=U5QHF1_GLOK1|nr:DUF1822 family protein [Gloeobacter kilaueensis]AGY58392.1 hypothetical protein GKIL_2146 [Gloeobacter kilaueensis JS1]